MKKLIIFYIICLTLVSQDVRILVGNQLPPYILEEYIGFEFEIIDTIFSHTIQNLSILLFHLVV